MWGTVAAYCKHIVVRLFKIAMDAAPHVLEFIDSIFPNFIRGGTKPEPPPEVAKDPRPWPGGAEDDGDGINSIP